MYKLIKNKYLDRIFKCLKTLNCFMIIIALCIGIFGGNIFSSKYVKANSDNSIWDGQKIDHSFFDYNDNILEISSAAQFLGLSDMCKKGFDFSNYTIKLLVDIDINNHKFNPIENFAGTLDGNGHTIKNAYIVANNDKGAGVFSTFDKKTTIKNLNFEKIDVMCESVGFNKLAIIVGANNAFGTEILNCNINDCYIGKSSKISNMIYAGFVSNESKGSIKVENINITNSMINGERNGRVSGVIQNIIHDKYPSVIRKVNIMNTYFISTGNPAYLFAGEGNANTIVSECYSNMWPTQLSIETLAPYIRPKFVEEYNRLYGENNRLTYEYILSTGEITSSGSVLYEVLLDEKDIYDDIVKNPNYISTDAFTTCVLNFGLEVDVEVYHNGVKSTYKTNTITINLEDGLNAVKVKATLNGISVAELKIVTNLISIFEIQTAKGEEITSTSSFIKRRELDFSMISFDEDTYYLVVKNIPEFITLKNGENVLSPNEKIAYTAVDAFKKKISLDINMYNDVIQIESNLLIAKDNVFNKVDDETYEVCNAAGVKYEGLRILLNETYPWNIGTFNGSNYLYSTNQEQNSTKSYIIFEIASGKTISFLYACSSENNWDYLYFDANGTITNTKGKNNQLTSLEAFYTDQTKWTEYTFANTTEQTVLLKVYYAKDSSGKSGLDTAYIKNIAFQNNVLPKSRGKRQNSSNDYGTLYTDNIFYKYEDEKKFVLDENTNSFTTEKDNAENATITFTITNSDIFYFEFDDSTMYTGKIKAIFDGKEVLLSGDGVNGDFVYKAYAYNFDTVGTHTIKIQFTYYGWYACSIRNVQAFTKQDNNVKITTVGEGMVYDIYGFNEKTLIGENTFGTLEEFQLYAKTPAESSWEYVGYKVKNADGSFSDLITTNADIITVSSDLEICVFFEEKINVENQIQYSVLKNGTETSNGLRQNYEAITLDEILTDTQMIYQVKDIAGYSVKVRDNGKELTLLADRGMYFYTLSDFSVSHEIDFIYYGEGKKDTIIKLYIDLIPNINKYLVMSDSKPIELINDDKYPLIYSESKSASGKLAYVTTNYNQDASTSGIALKVKGNGVVIFDYFVSSEANSNRYSTADSGDKLLYGINTPLDFKTVLSTASGSYGHILEKYTGTVGYAGANLGETNTSLSQGETGWQKGIIAVSGQDDEESIVYIGYVKDEYTKQNDDMAGIANVGFISANFDFSYKTNSETASISAKINGVETPSGSTVSAGNKVVLTVTNTNTSERFYGWIDADGQIVSKETTYTYSFSKSLDISAIYITETSKIMANNVLYETIEEAIDAVGTSKEVLIRILSNVEITSDLIIPNNVTLLLPFELDDETGTRIGTASVNRPSWGRGITPFVTITIKENVTVTINGKLIVGGVQHAPNQASQGMTSGDYAQLINNGSLIVNGNMDVRGLVTGSGTLTLNNGATLKEPFTVDNYSGGTNTSNLYENNQFPFVQFATSNIKCNKVFNYGSKVIGTTSLYFWGGIHTQDVILVDKIENKSTSSEGSLIWLHSGSSLNVMYDGKAVNKSYGTIHLGDSGLNIIEVNGTITAGEFSLQGYGSNDMVLSIPYTYNFIIKNDARVILDHKYKLMPGSIITINEGGTLEIGETGGLYVYSGLLQAPKSGKEYPSSSDLKNNGFYPIGTLINNGTMDIKGQFLGTIQTTGNTGIISVASTASVTPQVITDGSAGGYTDNRSIFELKAEIYGLYGKVQLESGKTYKAYNADEFTVEKYIMSYYKGNSGSSVFTENVEVTINETLKGRFLEYKDGKYYGDVEFYIGEEVENISIIIDGITYKTDRFGKITVNVAIEDVRYKSLFDKREHTTTISLNEATLLDEVVKTIELSDTNNYELVYDKFGNVTKELVIKGVVTFHSGKTEIISLHSNIDETMYVNVNVVFTCDNYQVDLSHDIYVSTKEIAIYQDDYEALKSSNDLINEAIKLYASYNKLNENRTAKEIEYLSQLLINHVDYIQTLPIELTVSSITYGDTEVQAVLTFLDGNTKNTVVNKTQFEVLANTIKAKATYEVTYYNAAASLTATTNNVLQANVTIVIDNKSSVYGDELAQLTATATLLNEDTIVDVVDLIKEDGTKPGQYVITAVKKHPGYNITIVEGEYQITKRKIDVVVLDHKDIMKASANKISDIETAVEGNVDNKYEFSFELYQNDIYITSIDTLGNVLGLLDIGTYHIKPIIKSEYYEIENITMGEITILIDNTYYDVYVTFEENGDEITKKVYDGKSVTPIIRVVKHDTNEEVTEGISYTVTGNVQNEILKAGIYTINVTVNEVEYQNKATFEIEKREIAVDIEKTSFVYNGSIQYPTFIVTSKVLGDEVEVITKKVNTVNVGNYIVEAINLEGKDADNYMLKTNEKREYEIIPLTIQVRILKVTQVYGNEETALQAETNNEIPSVDTINSIVKLTKEAGNTVGKYDVLGEVINNNYLVEFIDGEKAYEITPLETRVIIDEKTSVYGDDLVALTATMLRRASQDETLADESIYKLYKEQGNDAGQYLIKGETINPNYAITFVEALYTIQKRGITVKVNDETSVYGEALKNNVLEITSGSLKQGEKLNEVVMTKKETGVSVGVYEVEGVCISNNYDVRFIYTSASFATYEITPRAIEITVNNLTINNKTTYVDLVKQLSYVVSKGNIIASDELNICLSVIMNGKIITSENYHKHLSGGKHIITATYNNPNYIVEVVDGTLEVIKPQVKVVNIETDFIYTGMVINNFNYLENIEGYLESATSSAFKAWYYRSGDEQKAEVELRNAGTYIMVIEIVHKTSYEFTPDTVTEYEITIAKKNITDEIVINGIEKENYININTLPRPLVSMKEMLDIMLEQKLYKDNIEKEAIDSLGEYLFTVTVVDDNYEGYKEITFVVIENIATTMNNLNKGRLDLERKRGLEMLQYSDILKETIDNFTSVELVLIANNEEYQTLIDIVIARNLELHSMYNRVIETISTIMDKYYNMTDDDYTTKYEIYGYLTSLDEISESFIDSEDYEKIVVIKEHVQSVLDSANKIVKVIENALVKINSQNQAAKLEEAHNAAMTLTLEERKMALLDEKQGAVLKEYETLWNEHVQGLENVYTISDSVLNAQLILSIIMVMTMLSAAFISIRRDRF